MRMEFPIPTNRIAAYFQMNKSSTRVISDKTQAKINLAKNLKWEMSQKKVDAEELAKLLHQQFPNEDTLSAFTIKRYLNAKTGQPPFDFLLQLSGFFGYEDPNSIMSIDHIERRVVALGLVENDKPLRPINKDLAAVMPTLEKAIGAQNDQTLDSCRLLINDTESKRLFSFVVYWMEEKFRQARETASAD